MLSKLSDAELIKLVISGDHNAFAELVGRHTDQAFRVAFYSLQNRSDAEDVVQNVFIKLWQRPHLWNSEKSKLSTWLHRVVINACHDVRRRYAKTVDIDDESLNHLIESAIESTKEPSSALEDDSEQIESLEYAIARLSQKQRDAINLVVYAELSQRDAADILGVSLKAFESLLVRAKRKIRSLVVQQNSFDNGNSLYESRHRKVSSMPISKLNKAKQSSAMRNAK